MRLTLNKIHLYFHTIRYLTTKQILYRLVYLIKRKYYCKLKINNINKKLGAKEEPKSVNDIYLEDDKIKHYNFSHEKLLSNNFTFLNQTISFGNIVDWHYTPLNQGTRLWKLNLNYHEYLIDIAKLYKNTQNKKYLNYIQNHIKEWWYQNPFGTSEYYKDNWNAYAVSLRTMAWIKIYQLINNAFEYEFEKYFLHSLKIQLNYLINNLELDIKGNHLLENGFALMFGAYFFKDKHLYNKAKKLLYKELEEQILADGGHFELSPMYHQAMLYRVLDCFNLVKNNSYFNHE